MEKVERDLHSFHSFELSRLGRVASFERERNGSIGFTYINICDLKIGHQIDIDQAGQAFSTLLLRLDELPDLMSLLTFIALHNEFWA